MRSAAPPPPLAAPAAAGTYATTPTTTSSGWRPLLLRRRPPHCVCRTATRPSPAAAAACRSYRAATDPLVSTAWLAARLDAGDVSVLDVRGRVETAMVAPGVERSSYFAERDAYLSQHIPGAVFWDWTADGIAPGSPSSPPSSSGEEEDGGGGGGVPVQLDLGGGGDGDSAALAALLEAKGVAGDRPVVVYDGGDDGGMFAARLWWSLTCAGHPDVRILHGGFAAWAREGRETELAEPCVLKLLSTGVDCSMLEAQPQLLAEAGDVLALVERLRGQQQQGEGTSAAAAAAPPPLLIDTRNAAQFSGAVRRGPRGGRIPGAVCLPRAALLDDGGGGGLLPLERQRAVLEAAGVVFGGNDGGSDGSGDDEQQQEVVLYCNGGVAACTAALALHRLGHRRWRVYDGSWNEWGARRDLLVEQE